MLAITLGPHTNGRIWSQNDCKVVADHMATILIARKLLLLHQKPPCTKMVADHFHSLVTSQLFGYKVVAKWSQAVI